ncbi:alkaline phosphatase family protein [Sporosarcina sp. A2]|uniref:alkaline phosphatase family protein n=1 Tax=Sporosarcina sp. A2 TaxID=3393449 RepID=UPI003D791735
MTSIITQPVFAAETTGTISVVSFDGLGYMDAQRYMDKGIMRNLEEFQQAAAYATDFITVMPSLTAPSHGAMATGAQPVKTGIVSNEFHTLGEKTKDNQSGFSQTLGVTPIWKKARNQGKVTATVAFPDSNPDNASAATYAVYSGGTLAQSALHNLKFSTVEDERVHQIASDSVEVEEAVVTLDTKDYPTQQLFVLRTDEKDPKLYISTDQKEIGEEILADDWNSIELDLPPLDSAGFYVKLKGDIGNKDELQLFQGTVMGGLYRGPDNFPKQIGSEFGFYPAADELEAFTTGIITREEYEQVGERFAKWVTDVSLYIKDTYQPDLLFYYYPTVDTELHKFLLREPDQPSYDLKNVQEKEKYVSWAFGQADQAIGRIKNNQNAEDHLLLISDHGLEPIHTRLSPNKELEKAGLLVKDKNGAIDSSKTKAYAEASGTIAHVYVNLKGREKKGIVEPAEFEKVKQEIVSVFTNRIVFSPLFQDPRKVANPILRWLTGKGDTSYKAYPYPKVTMFSTNNPKKLAPYEKIWTDDNGEYASLNNGNSGDVFLSAASGFLMGKDANIAAEPTMELGSHGGDPERPRLRPILYASGPGISPGELSDRITMTDIAPSLYDLLGLQAPDFVDGQPIW